MIKKRLIAILMILVMLTLQIAVFAEPSEWAVEFVEPAIADNLVPEALRTNYQDNITRYEYVLIALSVLDQNNMSVNITESNPFTDIAGHTYESEIIRAYNANIVGGYEDNTFRPNQEIKREEVAVLVFNLVKAINVNSELPKTKSVFSDNDKISSWAKPYVEFNYIKSIIAGTGKINGLDTMDPLGKATREQAITLLYKVSKNKELLAQYSYNSILTNDGSTTANQVKKAADSVGYQTMNKIIELSAKASCTIDYVLTDAVTLVYENASKISLQNLGYQYNYNMLLTSLDDSEAIEDFKSLLDLTYPNNMFTNGLINTLDNFKTNPDYVLNTSLSDGGTISLYALEEDGVVSYYISYIRED